MNGGYGKIMKNSYLNQFRDGIIFNNPTFIQLLGMCPTLAVTTSVPNAFGMGVAVIVVLAFSNLFISLVRNFIPKEVRIASFVVIISGFVTAVELLVKAFLPALDKSLGIFIPLIVVNCIILARAEAFASKNPPLPSFVDGIAMGTGFTLALSLIASVREILGAGTFCGIQVMGDWYRPATLFILPAGAFLTLGFLIALIQKLMYIMNKKKDKKPSEKVKTAEISDEENSIEPIEPSEPETNDTEETVI